MVVTKTIWCSQKGDRELLVLNHTTRQVSTPAYALAVEDLPELEAAARECFEMLAWRELTTPSQGGNAPAN
jgi:hypothetical protein